MATATTTITPIPHVLGPRHHVTIYTPISQPFTFVLWTINASATTTATVTEGNGHVSWGPATCSYDPKLPNLLRVISTPSVVVPAIGRHHLPFVWDSDGGDGTTTIVITNPPDTNGDPAPDPDPPVIPMQYTVTTS